LTAIRILSRIFVVVRVGRSAALLMHQQGFTLPVRYLDQKNLH